MIILKKIFFEKPNWNAEPKINTYNEDFIENHRRAAKQTPVCDFIILIEMIYLLRKDL